jgi:hypothetical protein
MPKAKNYRQQLSQYLATRAHPSIRRSFVAVRLLIRIREDHCLTIPPSLLARADEMIDNPVNVLCCGAFVGSCNGFRMPAPITEPATRTTAAGPAFESRQ